MEAPIDGMGSPAIVYEAFNPEFLIDGDEGSPLSGFFPATDSLPKELEGMDSPSLTFNTPNPRISTQSKGSRDSGSDNYSSSPWRADSSMSSNNSWSPAFGDDATMYSGHTLKQEKTFEEILDEPYDEPFDEAGNATALDDFLPVDMQADMKADMQASRSPVQTDSESPASSLSPSAPPEQLSPPMPTMTDAQSAGPPSTESSPTDYLPALAPNGAPQSYSLTRSMNGLTTEGSPEVSSTAILNQGQVNLGQELSSPPSMPTFDFHMPPNVANQAVSDQWAAYLGLYLRQPEEDEEKKGKKKKGLDKLLPFDMGNVMTGATLTAPLPFHQPRPPANTSGPYRLKIQHLQVKSRVETQIQVRLTLSPLPLGIKRLHLPRHSISKPKNYAKPPPERSDDMLELHAVVVCTSAMQNPQLRDRALQRALEAAQSSVKVPSPSPSGTEEEGKAKDGGEKGKDGGEVQICDGCIQRERKRAGRKKVKKTSPEEDKAWIRDESKRIIVFNCTEIKEWRDPSTFSENLAPGVYPSDFFVDVPMRIACYCRHHSEKLGFQFIFTITDHANRPVAQAMSSSIMITDDHKTPAPAASGGAPPANTFDSVVSPQTVAKPNRGRGRAPGSYSPTALPGTPFHVCPPNADPHGLSHTRLSPGAPNMQAYQFQVSPSMPASRNLSRAASPTGLTGPCNKKRKSSGTTKIPANLTMTQLNTPSPHAHPHQPNLAMAQAPITPAAPAFPPSPSQLFMPTPPDPQVLFGANPFASDAVIRPLPVGPPTPGDNCNDPPIFPMANRSTSLEDLTMGMYSAPASAHPSRAPSPTTGYRAAPAASASAQQHNRDIAHLLANAALYTGAAAVTNPPPPAPVSSVIHKIIPAEGPKSGGIEVTVLGSDFFQGIEVMFGDVQATTTTYWGSTSLVCLLPPSPVAGSVRVTFKHKPPQQNPKLFKYVDDDEQQLMRTALTVLGNKMNGRIEDVTHIARRIIDNSWASSSSTGERSAGAGAGGSGFNSLGLDVDMNLESQLLKVLELIDLDDSTNKPKLNLKRATGQTMLHLACSLGFHRFVAGLLARNANPDVRDKGGYTPLHMAALNDHPEIVRRLIACGADPTLRTLSGLTAADVAKSRAVLQAVRRIERHARSRSGGSSLHSRASSANSLKSLWEPFSATHLDTKETSSDESGETDEEESLEYSQNATSEDEDENQEAESEDETWLHMRTSRAHQETPHPAEAMPDHPPPPGTDAFGGLGSPSAAVNAFKGQLAAQIQQFQQTMALHLQNLPQFPYLPQMPNMPPLPDYQMAVLQRLASMVPTAIRPGSAGEQPGPSAKELEGRWWDFSSLMPGSPPPPSYEEIFPRHEQTKLEEKKSSAALAAAEAVADTRCAVLYDQPNVSSTSLESATQSSTSSIPPSPEIPSQNLPRLLQIGRKNAITREQQDNLRRAHAEKLKRLSRDRNLFFIWIPLLLIVLFSMVYNKFPGVFGAIVDFITSLFPVPNVGGGQGTVVPDLVERRVVEVV
ncbi:ankyrin repeat protein [Diplogelasinospora grovesii]|uniref:Ankyrin repeat protein n=1 Tax=Diplogelasinospora grovesii TaxID=303347 RepID=A0AAN6SAL7_9PEZI|nr:ankyrin repeat protein [Diplogelasinospora grovesii]